MLRILEGLLVVTTTVVVLANFSGLGNSGNRAEAAVHRLHKCRGSGAIMNCPVIIGTCSLNGPFGTKVRAFGSCGVGCNTCEDDPCAGTDLMTFKPCSTALGCWNLWSL